MVLAASFFVIQGSSAMAYALFGARVFQWLRQRNLARVQNRVTAVILFCAGGILAVSKK
jgi:homoserine/homoserine lactone efflux protein